MEFVGWLLTILSFLFAVIVLSLYLWGRLSATDTSEADWMRHTLTAFLSLAVIFLAVYGVMIWRQGDRMDATVKSITEAKEKAERLSEELKDLITKAQDLVSYITNIQAKTYMREGRYKAATMEWIEGMRKLPEPLVRETLDAARETFEDAMESVEKPEKAKVLYQYARLLASQGEKDEASAELGKAVELDESLLKKIDQDFNKYLSPQEIKQLKDRLKDIQPKRESQPDNSQIPQKKPFHK